MQMEVNLSLRTRLVKSANIRFQSNSQKSDLLDPTKTVDNLVSALWYITREYFLVVTAVYSDHHPDGYLGPHGHHPDEGPGYCVDCWPIRIFGRGWSYYDGGQLEGFLQCVKNAPHVYEIGLAGTAYRGVNMLAASGGHASDVFEDDGADHIHIGVR